MPALIRSSLSAGSIGSFAAILMVIFFTRGAYFSISSSRVFLSMFFDYNTFPEKFYRSAPVIFRAFPAKFPGYDLQAFTGRRIGVQFGHGFLLLYRILQLLVMENVSQILDCQIEKMIRSGAQPQINLPGFTGALDHVHQQAESFFCM